MTDQPTPAPGEQNPPPAPPPAPGYGAPTQGAGGQGVGGSLPPQPGYGVPPAGGYGAPTYGAPTYGTPTQPPPGYGPPGAPQPGWAPVPRTSGKAIAVMVLGIVGIVMACGYGVGLIPAIVALCLAPGAKREIRESRGTIQGEGQVTAGVVCSWIAVGLVVVAVLAFLALFAVGSSSDWE